MSPFLRITALCAAATLGCACGDDDAPARKTRRMQTQAVHTPMDAGVPDAPPAPASKGGSTAEFHLDPTVDDSWQPRRKASTPPRILRLTLRSTPPGATALVDGVPVGVTPTYWEGAATGKPRNFVFTLRGHALARYRFVPTTHGIVHATLKKLVVKPLDAGPVDDAAPAGAAL